MAYDRLGRPEERVSVAVEFGYPPDIQASIEAVDMVCRRGTPAEQYEAFFALASALLFRAHDVSTTTACKLLTVERDDLPRLVRDVMSVVSEANGSSPAEVEGQTIA